MITNIINDDSLAYEMYFSDASSINTQFGINPKITELIEKDFFQIY
jgi:hypothetical protein